MKFSAKLWHKPDYPASIRTYRSADGLAEPIRKRSLRHATVFGLSRSIAVTFSAYYQASKEEIQPPESCRSSAAGQCIGSVYDIEKVRQAEENTRLEWLAQVVQSQPA